MGVLKGTMELVSPSKDEYALLRAHTRLSACPGLRAKLVGLRESYELRHAHRLGFDTLYPPTAATCAGDEAAADALREAYDSYLAVAASLFAGMSVSGASRGLTWLDVA
jgi:hypothetical protein